jgi:hypothetical protein
MHTTVSAHPFIMDLPEGTYRITVERGKEYRPMTYTVVVKNGRPEVMTMVVIRWIDLASRGWYSGDTHVHRTMEELPNVMLAEDVNVTFPLNYWVTEAFESPQNSDDTTQDHVGADVVTVDPTHVIYPMNTEYEIFTVDGKDHWLGAVFILNHKTPFDVGVPPVKPVAERAHGEGALLELDKHNWPWSMMLVPVMGVDLYELSNNHVWRTGFHFKDFGEPAPPYMKLDASADGWTEWSWIDFGFQNYYALLNCGFRLRPTAGTASGVHPVPLGFGRVYVHLPDGFSYDGWIDGLGKGRSFVTTGPMLFVTVNDKEPGYTFTQRAGSTREYRVAGEAMSTNWLDRIEIVVNGEIVRTIEPDGEKTATGANRCAFDEQVSIDSTSWIAIRCIEEMGDGRIRFAHSSPVHVDVEGRPLQPRREEIAFLINRIEQQIARSSEVLPEEAISEYQEALNAYRRIAEMVEK